MKHTHTKKRVTVFGFTLVELMVAISIIGLLTAVILPSFTAAKKKSRVTQRVSDMKQVEAALAFYYAVNRAYPSTGGPWRSVCPGFGAFATNDVIPGLAPTYIPIVPTDPQSLSTSDNNCYLYKSDGNDYAFLDHNVTELFTSQDPPTYMAYPELLDPVRDGGSNPNIVDPGTNSPWAWKVSSAGGYLW